MVRLRTVAPLLALAGMPCLGRAQSLGPPEPDGGDWVVLWRDAQPSAVQTVVAPARPAATAPPAMAPAPRRVAGSFVGSLLGVAVGGTIGYGAAYLMDPGVSDDIDLPLVLGPMIVGSVVGGFGAHVGNGGAGNVGLASLAALGAGAVGLLAIDVSSSTGRLVLQVGLPMAAAAGAVAVVTGKREE